MEMTVRVLNCSLTKIENGMRGPPTCNLTNSPAPGSRMLIGDWGRDKRLFSIHGRSSRPSISIHFYAIFLHPIPIGARGKDQTSLCSPHIALRWSNPELRGLQSCKTSSRQAHPLLQMETWFSRTGNSSPLLRRQHGHHCSRLVTTQPPLERSSTPTGKSAPLDAGPPSPVYGPDRVWSTRNFLPTREIASITLK